MKNIMQLDHFDFYTRKELLIQDLIKIKENNNLEILEQNDYLKYGGKYHVHTFRNYFGSWKEALNIVGLKSGDYTPNENELFDELQKVWEKLGRQPKQLEVSKYGKYSFKYYTYRYGNWIKSIYAFVNDRNQEIENDKNIDKMYPSVGIA